MALVSEDTELLKLVAKGDRQAFRVLVKKHKSQVFNKAYAILGNAHEAEDVAQDVFLEVYYSLGSFKGRSLFSTWLYRVTVNKCLDALKKRKKNVISLEDLLKEDEISELKDVLKDSGENVESVVLRKELQEGVLKVIDSLPEKYRAIITLKEHEHLSYTEISEIMKISMDKVKIWLFRARALLKERLLPLYRENVSGEKNEL